MRYGDYSRDWTTLGLIPGGDERFFFSPERPSRLKGPPRLLFSGFLCSLPGWGVKGLGRDVYHLPASSSELQNEWSYTSTPTVCLHGLYREYFTFLPFSYV
jgi:hypothetical protein